MVGEKLLLRVEDLVVRYGGLTAAESVSFRLESGEILGVIGPNGAGKTSVINAVTGVVRPSGGRVYLAGADITGLPPHEVARRGIGRTFQIPPPVGPSTVVETVMLGLHPNLRYPWWLGAVPLGPAWTEEVRALERAEEVLDFLELGRFRDRPVATLPLGLRKLVDLGRALCLRPRVLLLDEPAAGLVREEKEDLARFILRIKYEQGVAVVWVEHDLDMIMDLADRIMALSAGRVLAEGEPEAVLKNPEVVTAYLGKK